MTSNKAKAIAAVDRLNMWIATDPDIPLHRGKINKSRICSILKIPVSTIRTNKELGQLFEILSKELSATPINRKPERPPNSIQALLDKVTQQEQLIEKLSSENARAQFLLATGIPLP